MSLHVARVVKREQRERARARERERERERRERHTCCDSAFGTPAERQAQVPSTEHSHGAPAKAAAMRSSGIWTRMKSAHLMHRPTSVPKPA